jgi:hypothetical protein
MSSASSPGRVEAGPKKHQSRKAQIRSIIGGCNPKPQSSFARSVYR